MSAPGGPGHPPAGILADGTQGHQAFLAGRDHRWLGGHAHHSTAVLLDGPGDEEGHLTPRPGARAVSLVNQLSLRALEVGAGGEAGCVCPCASWERRACWVPCTKGSFCLLSWLKPRSRYNMPVLSPPGRDPLVSRAWAFSPGGLAASWCSMVDQPRPKVLPQPQKVPEDSSSPDANGQSAESAVGS